MWLARSTITPKLVLT